MTPEEPSAELSGIQTLDVETVRTVVEAVTAPVTSGATGVGRARDRLLIAVFVLFLTLPGLALLAGFRPQNVENRTFASAPPVRLERLGDPAFYASTDTFVTDNFPLRADAISVKGRFIYEVLGMSNNPLVTVGRDGWLYLTQDFQPICVYTVPALLSIVDRFTAAFAAKGIDLWLVIVPDKRTVYPEHLPGSSGDRPCTEVGRDELRAGIAARPTAMIELWSPILAAKNEETDLLYPRLDSHWTPAGTLVGVRTIVGAIAPGVWDPSAATTQGVDAVTGSDLARLIGLPRVEDQPHVVVSRRDRIDEVAIDNEAVMQTPWFTLDGPDPVVPGRTLFVTDSALWGQMPMVAPWFAESVWLNFQDLFASPDVARSLPHLRRVVVETVERSERQRDFPKMLTNLLNAIH